MILALISGGQDSVCLLDVLLTRGDEVEALHVNYGLRAEADADEAFCRALCDRLGVRLHVVRAGEPEGNLQAWARRERYAAAEAIATGDIATGHTATDQVETILYRLAASPGRRALLGMRERDGRLIRPLLGMTREETAAHCRARGLTWREDATNADPAYARNRIRHTLVPALRIIHPAAEANVLRTLETLRDEAAVLDTLVSETLAGRTTIEGTELEALPPALRRLVFTTLAGAPVGHRVDEVIALSKRGGTRHLDLGHGLRATTVYGHIEVEGREEAFPPAELGLGPPTEGMLLPPSGLNWNDGRVHTDQGDELDADRAGELRVRSWRHGDRIGTKSLQDLFTNHKVPRRTRHVLPIVTAHGEIAWVPGIATSDAFKVTEHTRNRVRLRWVASRP